MKWNDLQLKFDLDLDEVAEDAADRSISAVEARLISEAARTVFEGLEEEGELTARPTERDGAGVDGGLPAAEGGGVAVAGGGVHRLGGEPEDREMAEEPGRAGGQGAGAAEPAGDPHLAGEVPDDQHGGGRDAGGAAAGAQAGRDRGAGDDGERAGLQDFQRPEAVFGDGRAVHAEEQAGAGGQGEGFERAERRGAGPADGEQGGVEKKDARETDRIAIQGEGE